MTESFASGKHNGKKTGGVMTLDQFFQKKSSTTHASNAPSNSSNTISGNTTNYFDLTKEPYSDQDTSPPASLSNQSSQSSAFASQGSKTNNAEMVIQSKYEFKTIDSIKKARTTVANLRPTFAPTIAREEVRVKPIERRPPPKPSGWTIGGPVPSTISPSLSPSPSPTPSASQGMRSMPPLSSALDKDTLFLPVKRGAVMTPSQRETQPTSVNNSKTPQGWQIGGRNASDSLSYYAATRATAQSAKTIASFIPEGSNKRQRAMPESYLDPNAQVVTSFKASLKPQGRNGFPSTSAPTYSIYGQPTKSSPFIGSSSNNSSNRLQLFDSRWTSTSKKPQQTKPVTPESIQSREFAPALSPEQKRIFDMVVNERRSIFFTGSAGTGKSVLLRAIIAGLKQVYGDGVAVTASTGIAACNINGSTLHSFAGIGLGKDPVNIMAEKIRGHRKQMERWRRTQALIIDEISMIDATLFDKLEHLARELKYSKEPFGGIQVILTGDFFQLPPVMPDQQSKFAFEAESWNRVVGTPMMLTQVFRQKDPTFVEILNEMRLGQLSSKAIDIFYSLAREPGGDTSIQPTELYPLRRQVDESNNNRLNALPGEIREYNAHDSGDQRKIEQCIAPRHIKLKKHAQVMLLKNMDATLVNGSLGIVEGFVGHGKYRSKKAVRDRLLPGRYQNGTEDFDMERFVSAAYPVVRFAGSREVVIEAESWSIELPGGEVVASRTQIPLMLAWAMSIHKSQGQTLDRVRVDLGQVFEKGQAYVALSRATSLETLQILNFNPEKVMAHPRVAEFYRNLKTVNSGNE